VFWNIGGLREFGELDASCTDSNETSANTNCDSRSVCVAKSLVVKPSVIIFLLVSIMNSVMLYVC